MTDSRKVISIKSVPTFDDERNEIGGCAEAEPYALRVIGDDMAPEFADGDVVIVEPAVSAAHGSYIIAEYAGETIFRQLIVDGDRKFLKAVNAVYPVIELVGSYRLRGVVVQRVGKRRKDRKHY